MSSFVKTFRILLRHPRLLPLTNGNGHGHSNLHFVRFCYLAVRRLTQIAELSKDDIDNMLRKNEKTTHVAQDALHSFDTNQLPANSPCEDNYAEARCLENDAWLFGVFDGHAGENCSRAVSRRLYDYLAVCLLPHEKLKELTERFTSDKLLEWSACSSGFDLAGTTKEMHEENLRNFVAYCNEHHESLANVRQAFQTSFLQFDNDLLSDALRPGQDQASAKHTLSVVMSGSCALVAHVRGNHLHMVNVGDSVGVLGICSEQGVWTARQLTKEHCIENADEANRVRKEHPSSESTTVLRGGRLLGQLYPLRAFGDVRFKWTGAQLEQIIPKNFIPPNLLTPPYLTAKPEVFYHRLTPHDKFLVIATDGLWEMMTPDTVVRVISDHMTGRQTLTQYTPPPNALYNDILAELRLRKQGESKRPHDANAATHLIRCALGGTSGFGVKQYTTLASTLSRGQGKKARSMRDDITITVIYFDPIYLASHQGPPPMTPAAAAASALADTTVVKK